MKLVLASQGFETDEIARAVEKLVGKSLTQVNVAIINEAYVETDDQRWMIRELSNLAKYVGGRIRFVNLLALPMDVIEKELEAADLIYMPGGKLWTLPKLFAETGVGELLKRLAEQGKVIMGTSAGAIVQGRPLPLVYLEARYGERAKDILKYPTLGLAPFSIMPHYGREDHPIPEDVFALLSEAEMPVYVIADSQAVIYDGKVNFVGGEPARTYGA